MATLVEPGGYTLEDLANDPALAEFIEDELQAGRQPLVIVDTGDTKSFDERKVRLTELVESKGYRVAVLHASEIPQKVVDAKNLRVGLDALYHHSLGLTAIGESALPKQHPDLWDFMPRGAKPKSMRRWGKNRGRGR